MRRERQQALTQYRLQRDGHLGFKRKRAVFQRDPCELFGKQRVAFRQHLDLCEHCRFEMRSSLVQRGLNEMFYFMTPQCTQLDARRAAARGRTAQHGGRRALRDGIRAQGHDE